MGDVVFAHWHSKGNYILTATDDTLLWMFNADDGTSTIFSGHGANVTCANFSPDGKRVISVSEDMSLMVWDPKTGKNIRTI